MSLWTNFPYRDQDLNRLHVIDAQTLNDHVIITVPNPERPTPQRNEYDTSHPAAVVPAEDGSPHIAGITFDPAGEYMYVGTQNAIYEWAAERSTRGWSGSYVDFA